MPSRCSPSVAQALLPKGPSSDIVGMVVLVAALELEREVATIACGLICQMLVRPELPLEVASSAEEALLRYQAVHVCASSWAQTFLHCLCQKLTLTRVRLFTKYPPTGGLGPSSEKN